MIKPLTHEDIYFEKLAYERTSGYWQVAGRKFFGKMDCLQYASKIKDYKITYHCFDHAYSSLDWTKEPTESLDDIYKRRAKQLRDKYDYIMLSFSGGADSTNMLDTFIKNKIHVDEVVSYYPVQALDKLLHTFNINNKSPENTHFEYYTACLPKLKWLEKNHPEIKITLIDPMQTIFDIVLADEPEKLIKYGTTLAIYSAGERISSLMLKAYAEKHEKVCCVYAIDKPAIRYNTITKRFGVCIPDFSHNKGKFDIDGYRPIAEPFYHTPDMPEILHAQGKVLKKALMPLLTAEQLNPAIKDLIQETPFPGMVKVEEHSDLIKSILYSGFDPSIYQAKKHIIHFAGQEHDAWFFKADIVDPKIKDWFYGQHKDWLHGVDDELMVKDNFGIPIKFKPYLAKIYWC